MLNSLGNIVRFHFFDAGTYDDQDRLSFRGQSSPDFIDRISEATNGFRNLEQNSLSQVSYDATLATGQIEDTYIENGWDCQRLRWLMEIHETSPDGRIRATIITGYTDDAEVRGHNDAINPEVKCYVNNISQYLLDGNRSSKCYTGKLLAGQETNSFAPDNKSYIQTADVIATDMPSLGETSMEEVIRRDPSNYFDLVHDTVSATMVNSQNCSPSHYLSRMVNSTTVAARSVANDLASSNRNESGGYHEDAQDYGYSEHAIHKVSRVLTTATQERSLTKVAILSELAHRNPMLLSSACFYFADIAGIYPNIHNTVQVDYFANRDNVQAPGMGNILDNSPTAIAAREVCSILPVLALDEAVGATTVVIDSSSPALINVNAYRPMIPFLDNDDSYLAFSELVRQSLITCVQSMEQRFGHLIITADINVYGNSVIHVSLDYGQTRMYPICQFADAKMCPLITNDITSRLAMAAMNMDISYQQYSARYGSGEEDCPLLDSHYFGRAGTPQHDSYYRQPAVFTGQPHSQHQQVPQAAQLRPQYPQPQQPQYHGYEYPSNPQSGYPSPESVYPSPEQVARPHVDEPTYEPNQAPNQSNNFKW